MLLPDNVHPSWHVFLQESGNELLNIIKDKMAGIPENMVTPLPLNMLRFLQLNLDTVKVVIVGQDPYPQEGVATGRAFEVGPLKSWSDSFRNTSLRNIVRALYASENGEVEKFNEIKKKISEGQFYLLPPDQLFQYWEEQGVLLLNTSFSCQIGKPGSHNAIWKPFTNKLIAFLNESQPDMTWFLWGNKAKEVVSHIKIKNSIETTHPMICHKRPGDFLFGEVNVFEATNDIIDWVGTRKQ